MKRSMVTLALLLTGFSPLSSASSTAVTAANMQQQEARENARAAAIAASKAYGSQEQVVLEEPARSFVDWGAIIQPNGTVLTVRAQSVAATMGLQKDDKLTHINGKAINPRELASTLETIERLEHNEAFTVTIQRGSDTLELQGVAQATVIPGWRLEVDNTINETTVTDATNQSCGRVSVFFTPPVTRDFFPAFINTIDDNNVRHKNPNFKLATGEHIIGVHELISDRTLRRGSSLDTAKQLTLNVEANKTYYIAAHFIREKRFSRTDGGYWEPVVWKVTEHSCSLD
ncbi:PDZ domain-containing protein [Pseudidiomarina donghaiensis]|uniref:PDZ domain-containing protein n=1 Tax=Pseudidiomarina donghaiensis TaxID=519452 RepID=A0A432XDB7_9GAMM|nr:PDZ domain-containing protein [Pseudidiomarina donghaiensis]RUO46739.1 PDZ domain-containing protein [Pseudidiomarina donghaiensis]SFV24513.1 PDZ domain-containing protein [Pseudidiomarina donghaiensis]